MIVVLDTNVLVSALLNPDSKPGRILKSVIDGENVMGMTAHLHDELQRALGYSRVRDRLVDKLGEPEVERIPRLLARLAMHVANVEPTDNWITDDPDDNWVVQCALTCHADRIVTGDRHLLDIGSVLGVLVVSPAVFLQEITSAD